MNGSCITFEILDKMASYFKSLEIHDYDKLTTEEDWSHIEGEERLLAIRRVIKLGYIKPKHGDGFRWLYRDYRNIGLIFWHDEKGVLYPYYSIDDYGSVLPDFRIGNGPKEFLPDHWNNVVDHNNIIFLSDELVKEIKAAFESSEPNPFVKTEEKSKSILLEIKGYPHKVIVKNDCIFDPKLLPWATYNRNIIYFQD